MNTWSFGITSWPWHSMWAGSIQARTTSRNITRCSSCRIIWGRQSRVSLRSTRHHTTRSATWITTTVCHDFLPGFSYHYRLAVCRIAELMPVAFVDLPSAWFRTLTFRWEVAWEKASQCCQPLDFILSGIDRHSLYLVRFPLPVYLIINTTKLNYICIIFSR